MNFFVRTIKSFKPFEIAIWLSSVTAILLSFFLAHNSDYLTLAASLVGTTSLIFIAKGNVIGQFIIIVFAVFYGIISYYRRYYGEMITYLGMSAPIAIVSVVTWLRNSYNGDRTAIKINTIRAKEYALLAVLTAGVTVAFYFILRALGNASLITSTISIATSFLAAYLTMRRCEFYALAYGLNDIVLIVLWSIAAYDSIEYLPMVVCFVVFLVNDMYGFINWSATKRRQAREKNAAAPPQQ